MVVPTRHVFVAAALAACFGFAQAQVPRGFARPGGNGQAARNDEPPAGHVNAKMGMAGLHKLAKDPSALSEMMETLKDPEAMREAQRMMEDPAFQREMEKIAGPMRRAMGQPGGSPQTGEQNVRASTPRPIRVPTHARHGGAYAPRAPCAAPLLAPHRCSSAWPRSPARCRTQT